MSKLGKWIVGVVVVGVVGFMVSNDIRDYKNGQWYAAHCYAPKVDNHGAVVVSGGDQWPCSTDNPLP